MLVIPGLPLLDKDRLVGGCVRLPIATELACMKAEVEALPEGTWGSRAGRVGVHRAADAIFLRGHAPAEGNLPVEDRDVLDRLPSFRELIHGRIPAPPMRCLLALLPGGATIPAHVDQPPYFGQTIRIHVPIVTHPAMWMYCAGRSYRMAEGEVWALNNSTLHAVWNADPQRSRLHMICDFLPSDDLVRLLLTGERDLGAINQDVEQHLLGTAQASA